MIEKRESALIIMAHGSRRDSANKEFFELVKRIEVENSDYNFTVAALLEQSPPTLLQAFQSLPESVTEIDVYPMFFNCGRHVEKDIPAQVAEMIEFATKQRESQVNVRLLPYFGSNENLAKMMSAHITAVNSVS